MHHNINVLQGSTSIANCSTVTQIASGQMPARIIRHKSPALDQRHDNHKQHISGKARKVGGVEGRAALKGANDEDTNSPKEEQIHFVLSSKHSSPCVSNSMGN